jgi:hypothetical protein
MAQLPHPSNGVRDPLKTAANRQTDHFQRLRIAAGAVSIPLEGVLTASDTLAEAVYGGE